MTEPVGTRPHMPGYGVAEGTEGLLPWSWAEERIAESAEMWLATTGPGGRPHVMPVWAVWLDGAMWVSTAPRSRKARNLLADPRCTITTDDTRRPLIIDGVAEVAAGQDDAARVTAAVNEKYGTSYEVGLFLGNALFRIVPERAFGLEEDRFDQSPTRWTFPPEPADSFSSSSAPAAP